MPVLTVALVLALQSAPATALSATRACSGQELDDLTSTVDAAPYRLTCRARLEGRDIVRHIVIEGAESSGAGLDCGGGAVGRPGIVTTTRDPTVSIVSRRLDGPVARWSRPTDIAITGCIVHGAVRVWGMGANGRIDDLRTSSRTPDHTQAAQAAAPSHVSLTDTTIVGTGSIPLYVGPGVTQTTVTNVRFQGRSVSTALYLDAESADTVVTGSQFDIVTSREQIAIDGSANNRLTGNGFVLRGRGGIFLYRNCGEDGVIRHQTPSDNVIADNVFTGASWLRPRTVVVGSREGGRSYCRADRGWPFGSSLDDGDHAQRNVVVRNRVVRGGG